MFKLFGRASKQSEPSPSETALQKEPSKAAIQEVTPEPEKPKPRARISVAAPSTKIIDDEDPSESSEVGGKGVSPSMLSTTSRRVVVLPKWLKHYRIFSYIMYGLGILTSVVYLCYTATIFFNKLYHIQYDPVFTFIAENTYNLQCPILIIILSIIFIYLVRFEIKLDDGDFFGIVGLFLLILMIMLYFAKGVSNLHGERVEALARKSDAANAEAKKWEPANERSWQNAWSTKPSCARHHAHIMRKIIAEDEKIREEQDPGDNLLAFQRPKDIHEDKESNEWIYHRLNKKEVQDGKIGRNALNPRSLKGDAKVYEEQCNGTANSKKKEKPRSWMFAIQKRFKCCGPDNNVTVWEERIDTTKYPCPKYSGAKIRGCFVPFNNYLVSQFYTSQIIMYLVTAVDFLVMLTTVLHFTAMKYAEDAVAKEYSLLDLREAEGIRVIDTGRAKSGTGHMLADPIRSLFFQQSNIRAQQHQTRGSTPGPGFHHEFAHSPHSKAPHPHSHSHKHKDK